MSLKIINLDITGSSIHPDMHNHNLIQSPLVFANFQAYKNHSFTCGLLLCCNEGMFVKIGD